jgi:hypothetical protein
MAGTGLWPKYWPRLRRTFAVQKQENRFGKFQQRICMPGFSTGSAITSVFLKRHLKINRAGDGNKIGTGVGCLVRKRTPETGMLPANYSGQTTLRINPKAINLEKDNI